MKSFTTLHRIARLAGAAAVLGMAAVATVAGPAHPAAADEQIGPPTLQSVRLEPPSAFLTFKDNSAIETNFHIVLRERDNPDRIVAKANVLSVPGEGRVATRSIGGVPSGVALCAIIQSQIREEVPFGTFLLVEASANSNTVCVDSLTPAPPDLALEKIRGREEWKPTESISYVIPMRNDGADATGTVVLEVATSGIATVTGGYQPGMAALGFTCVTKPASGTTTATLRCTGGSLKKGENTTTAILVRLTRPGYGAIHATISLSGGPAETDTSDNASTLPVRAL